LDRKQIDFLTPQEVKEHVEESLFSELKFEAQTGSKLGNFEVAYKSSNDAGKWTQSYNILSEAKATIKDRYHGKNYAFSYWLFGEEKIYRQQLKGKT